MSLQKYRADVCETQPDGARVWRTNWIGGPTLAKIENCRLSSLAGDMRVTAYAQGDADTHFSIPAKCRLFGKILNCYLTVEDADDEHNLVLRHCYY